MGLFSRWFGGESDKARYFRKLKNFLGLPEIEGLESVRDSRINEIYEEVKFVIESIAAEKKETIPENVINGIVRDMLIDEVHGDYQAQLKNLKDVYSKYEIRLLFVKGRIY